MKSHTVVTKPHALKTLDFIASRTMLPKAAETKTVASDPIVFTVHVKRGDPEKEQPMTEVIERTAEILKRTEGVVLQTDQTVVVEHTDKSFTLQLIGHKIEEVTQTRPGGAESQPREKNRSSQKITPKKGL